MIFEFFVYDIRFGSVDLPYKQKIGVNNYLVLKPEIGEEFRHYWGGPESLGKQGRKFTEKLAEEFAENFVGNSPTIRQTQTKTHWQPKSALQNLGMLDT